MDARSVRRVLLVQAYEPPGDAAWSAADAEWATAEARRLEGSSAPAERLIARRAELAVQRLAGRDPALARAAEGIALPPWVALLALAAAFVSGLLLDAFGGQARINVLALPLLGLLGWNLAVYGLLLAHGIARLAGRRASPHGLRDALARAAGAFGERIAGARRRSPALARFALAWAAAARPLAGARAATALHAMAALLALGLIAGMYLRGLAFEYRAGWESTLLDARGVHALVTLLLGPASALLGTPLPGVDAFAGLRFPGGAGENAAPWIHRIAVTVLLFVVLPRLLLAAVALRRAGRLTRDLPLALGTPYLARLARELRGERMALRVRPYAHALAPEREAALRRQLAAALGVEPVARFDAPLAYGASFEPATADPPDVGLPPRELVLFSAGATPEAEVHGEALGALPAGTGVLVDQTDFRARGAGPDAARRLEQRQHAWRTMLEARGHAPVFVDLDDAGREPPAGLADLLLRP